MISKSALSQAPSRDQPVQVTSVLARLELWFWSMTLNFVISLELYSQTISVSRQVKNMSKALTFCWRSGIGKHVTRALSLSLDLLISLWGIITSIYGSRKGFGFVFAAAESNCLLQLLTTTIRHQSQLLNIFS